MKDLVDFRITLNPNGSRMWVGGVETTGLKGFSASAERMYIEIHSLPITSVAITSDVEFNECEIKFRGYFE